MALVLAPEPPLGEWLAALDAQIATCSRVFRPAPGGARFRAAAAGAADVAGLIEAIAERGIRIIGTEGAHPSWPGVAKWGGGLGPPSGARAPAPRPARPVELPEEPRALSGRDGGHDRRGYGSTLLIDHPVRSGQSVVFEAATSPWSAASPPAPRWSPAARSMSMARCAAAPIAGLAGNSDARIFCRRLEAELLAIDGLYRTADDMDASLRGKPAQAWLDGESVCNSPRWIEMRRDLDEERSTMAQGPGGDIRQGRRGQDHIHRRAGRRAGAGAARASSWSISMSACATWIW